METFKIVRENITSFERGGDPYRKLGIGRIYQIDKWFSDLGISSNEYTIDKDFNINVYGDLYLGGTNITSLPDNLSVRGWLDLDGTDITSLPNDLNVGKSLFLRVTKITSLPNDLSVGGYLYLGGTDITSLPNDLNVKEEIWLDEDKEDKVYVPKHLKKKVKYV